LVKPKHKKPLQSDQVIRLDQSMRRPMSWARDAGETTEVRDVDITVREVVTDVVKAGFHVWVAGGAVRDAILGISPEDIDLAGTAPFGCFAEALQETLRRFKLNVGINSDRHVLNVHDTRRKDEARHLNRVLEYAPLKANWCSAERLFHFDGDPNKDSLFRDLSFNALYACLEADTYGNVNIGDHVLDPTEGAQCLPANGAPGVEPRILPWPSEIPEGAPAQRLLRLVKFVYKKKDKYSSLAVSIDCSNAFMLLSGGAQAVLDDFNALPDDSKRSLIPMVFGKDVERATVMEAFVIAERCGVDKKILDAFLKYA
jgi:hypothetical protein